MKTILMSILMCMSVFAYADEASTIRNRVQGTFNTIQIKEMKPVGDGIYEITTADSHIIYANNDYLILGNLISYSGINITKQAEEKRTLDKIEKIDKSIALRIGKGKKEVIEITDPECPYCLKAEDFFKDANVTRLVYFMPLSFHKDAHRLSVHILCSKEPEKEYAKVLEAVRNKTVAQFDTISCAAGRNTVDKMSQVAQELGVQGTPFFVIDGKVFSGADENIIKYLK